METTKTTKEAALIAARHYGKEAMIIFGLGSGELSGTHLISGNIIDLVSNGYVKSFRITSLRSLDEMSGEEDKEYTRLYWLIQTGEKTIEFSAQLTHYLESIGIDTMNLKDLTIEIKD